MLVIALAGLFSAGCGEKTPTAGGAGELVIAVVPKGTTFEFWKAVHKGARDAARDLGVRIIWKGPLTESDREGQINVMQDFITKRVAGICLAPLDSQALVGAVREAKAEGIPTVIFDSGLADKETPISYVATDNLHGGALAARYMGDKLGGSGRVMVLRYTPGSQSTQEREDGFLETLQADFPEIEIISRTEYAGASAESALDKAQQLLGKYEGKVDGIFTPCEHVSSGMLQALEERELAGKVLFIGFDASPRLVSALEAGKMHGLVLQDPVRMGYLAVHAMVSHLRGDQIAPAVSTGETLATKDNMNEPAVRRLLEPPTDDS